MWFWKAVMRLLWQIGANYSQIVQPTKAYFDMGIMRRRNKFFKCPQNTQFIVSCGLYEVLCHGRHLFLRRKLGVWFVVLFDCWRSKKRDEEGRVLEKVP